MTKLLVEMENVNSLKSRDNGEIIIHDKLMRRIPNMENYPNFDFKIYRIPRSFRDILDILVDDEVIIDRRGRAEVEKNLKSVNI